MGWHGGILGGFIALAMSGAVHGEVRRQRPETSKKRKQRTELRRQRKQERQARKRSRGR